MKERMRVRTPASNGSNQSSPRKSAVSAASAAGDVVSVVMASSPPALQRRSWLGEQAGDYAALTFLPPPRRHRDDPERPLLLFCPEQGGWQRGVFFDGRWLDFATLTM